MGNAIQNVLDGLADPDNVGQTEYRAVYEVVQDIQASADSEDGEIPQLKLLMSSMDEICDSAQVVKEKAHNKIKEIDKLYWSKVKPKRPKLKAGWYWAKHRNWNKTAGKWLMVYINDDQNWRGQYCRVYTNDDSGTAQQGRVEDFKDFTPIDRPGV